MSVYYSLAEVPAEFGPCALTIGNFDGVHVGHRHLFAEVAQTAREHGWKAAVMTFDPHPTRVVAPAKAPKLLSSPAERIALMQHAGIEQVLVLPFDEEFRQLSPEDFARQILRDRLQARAVFVGDNFRFGHKQAGDTALLAELGRTLGFTVQIVSGVEFRHHPVSSSIVRSLIGQGEVALAGRMLDRPYAVCGQVVSGEGIGRQQTVPTLNLQTSAEVLPGDGVYVTRTRDAESQRTWNSITNIGFRPTFDGQARTIETFLLEPLTGDPPRNIEVQFLRWIRGERKFPDSASLKTQILHDVARAQAYHRRLGKRVLVH